MTRWTGALPRREVIRHLATGVVLAALVFLQHPGRRFVDTKLDLAVDPTGFLARALHAWNPQVGFGELANQAYGYLFPMGPFFAAGQWFGLPSWVVERTWQSLLLVGAYAGAVRLAGRLGLGTPTTRWVAALAYALSPRILSTLGPISAESLGAVLLPWVLLPLVGWQSRTTARRAAALSGVAVLLIGGANAVVALAVLPLPFLWLALGVRERGGVRVLAWWLGAVLAACLWWLVPLLVLGRYASPFLDLIETASSTTAVVTPFEALRGTTHWVAYLAGAGAPWWRGGWLLVTSPLLILTTTVVAAFGLAGLAGRRMPGRTTLLTSAIVGLLVLTLGSSVSPLAGPWRELLDGPLAPMRNIHKFDPLLRLPLALGLAHALAVAPAWLGRAGGRRPALARVRRGAGTAVLPVVVAAVLVSTLPLLTGRLDAGSGWREIPQAWRQTANYLAVADPRGRSLVVPATGFAEQTWGRTTDEPLQPLAKAPWAVRDQVPLGAVGSTRLLDAIEQVLAAGRPSTGLAPALARSGVSHLVVRNDLDWSRSGSTRPAVVHAVVDQSPGLRKVAAFGPLVGPADRGPQHTLGYGLDARYPQVEVYAVDGAVPVARSVALPDVALLSGGPESLLPALAAGALSRGEPSVLTGQAPPWLTGEVIRADGLRRRDRDPTRASTNLGLTLGPDEQRRLQRGTPDLLPFDPTGHETTALYTGVASMRASSSRAYPDARGRIGGEGAPFLALDGQEQTGWLSSGDGDPVGQWWEVSLRHSVDVRGTEISLVSDLGLGPRVTQVRTTTDRGSRVTVIPAGGRAVLDTPPGRTRTLRVTVVATEAGRGNVGIYEIAIPGVTAERSLLLPDDARAEELRAVVLADDTVSRVTCLPVLGSTRCDPGLARGSEDSPALDRRFDLERDQALEVTGTVVARAGAADLLARSSRRLVASASSTLPDAVAAWAGAAVDGDPGTAWIASPNDEAPALTLSWPSPRRLDALTITAPASGAARPTWIRLETPTEVRDVDLTTTSTARFPRLTTDRVTLRVTGWEQVASTDPVSGLTTPLPPGIAELKLPALADLITPLDGSAALSPSCLDGPVLSIDGLAQRTRLDGTVADLRSGAAIGIVPCGDPLILTAGRHHVRLAATGSFAPASVSLRAAAPPRITAGRTTTVQRWDSEDRRVLVAPGPASLLVVPEGTNLGWAARLGGRTLEQTTVDGWQQAYLLPAGEGGAVKLTYLPGRTHQDGLVVGALVALGLVLCALVPPRRRHRRAQQVDAPASGAAVAAAHGLAPAGTAPWGQSRSRSRTRGHSVLAALLIVPVLVGGWVGVLAVTLGVVAGRSRQATAALVVLGPMVAATATAVDRHRTGSLALASSGWVSLLVLAAVSAAVAYVVRHAALPGPHQHPAGPSGPHDQLIRTIALAR